MKKLLFIALLVFTTVEIVTFTGCSTPPPIAPSAESRFLGKWTMLSAVNVTTTNGTSTPANYKFYCQRLF